MLAMFYIRKHLSEACRQLFLIINGKQAINMPKERQKHTKLQQLSQAASGSICNIC